MGRRVGRHDEAEPALVAPVGAEEFVAALVGAGQDDGAAGAEHDAPLVAQVAQGIAEGVVVLLAGQVELVRQRPGF